MESGVDLRIPLFLEWSIPSHLWHDTNNFLLSKPRNQRWRLGGDKEEPERNRMTVQTPSSGGVLRRERTQRTVWPPASTSILGERAPAVWFQRRMGPRHDDFNAAAVQRQRLEAAPPRNRTCLQWDLRSAPVVVASYSIDEPPPSSAISWLHCSVA